MCDYPNNLTGIYYYLYFTDEKTEFPKKKVTCLMSHSFEVTQARCEHMDLYLQSSPSLFLGHYGLAPGYLYLLLTVSARAAPAYINLLLSSSAGLSRKPEAKEALNLLCCPILDLTQSVLVED
jgi:hypothetical protein